MVDGYNFSQWGAWVEGTVQTEATTEDGCDFPEQQGAKKVFLRQNSEKTYRGRFSQILIEPYYVLINGEKTSFLE